MAQTQLNGVHALADVGRDELASERIFIAVTPSMLKEVEDYRFDRRYRSQSGAVRALLELGLQAAKSKTRI